LDAIAIYDRDRFIGYKPRVEIIDGNVEESVAQYLKNPEGSGMRISLLHFDCDLYRPTRAALSLLWPLVVKGGGVIFDKYAIRPLEGESNALDVFCAEKDVKFRKFDWSSNSGAYVIK
jgi:Macrocin-O-methyltransferase (TylF)